MKSLTLNRCLGLGMVSAAMMLSMSVAHALDADAASGLARQNNCFKCHSIEKKKDGPPFKELAAKYKGKPDAVAKIVHHLTSGEKAKFPDGHEEEHKVLKKDPAELKNLAEWILAQ